MEQRLPENYECPNCKGSLETTTLTMTSFRVGDEYLKLKDAVIYSCKCGGVFIIGADASDGLAWAMQP